MIDINQLRRYYDANMVFMTQHAENRSRMRNITQDDIKTCIMNGEIIEQYPDDYPYPSCLVYGKTEDGRVIHTVICDNGDAAKIITVYEPDTTYFKRDLKTRKEK